MDVNKSTRIYSFSNVKGNVNTVNLLRRSLIKDLGKNFLIFSGAPGTGKSTCAEIVGLYKTCDNPGDNAEPCLECKACVSNVRALQTTGVGVNLIKKNLGRFNSKKDVEEMIKEIFVLQSPIGNNVYILEEFHALDEICQTAMLEEIDRLEENVTVIICTTKLFKLLPELRSRGLKFDFNRLNNSESKMLVDTYSARKGYNVPNEISNLVISKSKGIPRDMVNLLDFIARTNPSLDEISDFLGHVGTNNFSDLIYSMTLGMKETVETLETLSARYTYDVLLEQFKYYITDVMFYVTGGITGSLDRRDTKVIRDIFDEPKVFKICAMLEKHSVYNTTEADFRMLMIRIRQTVVDKRVSDIVRGNMELASQQKVQANQTVQSRKDLEKELKGNAKNLGKMSLEDFTNFGG